MLLSLLRCCCDNGSRVAAAASLQLPLRETTFHPPVDAQVHALSSVYRGRRNFAVDGFYGGVAAGAAYAGACLSSAAAAGLTTAAAVLASAATATACVVAVAAAASASASPHAAFFHR